MFNSIMHNNLIYRLFIFITVTVISVNAYAGIKEDHFPTSQDLIGVAVVPGFSTYDEVDSYWKAQEGGNDSCRWNSINRQFIDHHPYNNSPIFKNEWRVRDLVCNGTLINTLALPISNVSCIDGYYLGENPVSGKPACLTGVDPDPECSIYEEEDPQNPANCLPKADPEKNAGKCCPIEGNPITVGTGNKFQTETDYQSTTPSGLRFRRYYNTQGNQVGPIGKGWVADYWERLIIHVSGESLYAHRADGKRNAYRRSGSQWVGDPDVVETLEAIKDGTGDITHWKLTTGNDTVEEYKDYGTYAGLISITDRNGLVTTIENERDSANGGDDSIHSPDVVTDPFGRQLVFSYNLSNYELEKMTDPLGNEYFYERDSNGNLSKVTYPDETPVDPNDNPTRIYHYEDSNFPHALTGITDETGNRYATWDYDSEGRAISSEHAGGVERVDILYNADGSATITDSLGRNQTYHFAILHGMVNVEQITGAQCSNCGQQYANTTYDANGYVASRTDFNGNQTTYINDARGLETSRTEADGSTVARTITTSWHANYRVPTIITEPGKTTTYSYDAQGRLLTRTETDTVTLETRTTTNTYNAQGLIASIDGPRTDDSDVTTFNYDTSGNLTKTTNALAQETDITSHDAHGRPLVIVDANNTTTALAYDARSRLVSRTVDGQTTTFAYDGVGNLTKTTLPNGSYLQNTYDAAQRLVAVEDNLGNRIDYTLDALGNRTQEDVKDPSGTLTRTMSRTYNSLNRLIETLGGEHQRTTYAYDANGNQTTITVDPTGLNQATAQAFDALNRLTTTTDAATGVTTYGYDARDNLVSVTDAAGLTTTYTYDGLDNLSQQQSPDTGTTTYTYDDAGNRLTQTDARNVTSTYAYDALNRLTSISYPDTTQNVSYTYDSGTGCSNGIGRLCQMTDASGTTDYSYDARGNLTSQTTTIDGHSQTTAYAYNGADQLTQLTYPSGRTVDYSRNVLGQITSISTTQNGVTKILASGIAYLPYGPMSGMTYGNNLVQSKTYDADYRLTGLVTMNGSAQQDLGYSYDDANNITAITNLIDSGQSQSLLYDALNRLTDATGGYGDHDYRYDAIGNRLTETRDSQQETYSYDTVSHRLAQTVGSSTQSYSYDANGNTLSNNDRDYRYGDNNRLQTVQQNGVTQATHTYNGRGERVKKAGSTTTYYHYDQSGQLIAETESSGTTQQEYVYLGGIPLASVQSTPASGAYQFSGHSIGGVAAMGSLDIDLNTHALHLIESNGQNNNVTADYWDESTYGGVTYYTFSWQGPNNRYISGQVILETGQTPVAEVSHDSEATRSHYYPLQETATSNEYTGVDSFGSQETVTVQMDINNTTVTVDESNHASQPLQVNWNQMTFSNGNQLHDFHHFETGVYTYGSVYLTIGGNKIVTLMVEARPFPNTYYAMTGQVLASQGVFYYHTDHLGTPQQMTDDTQTVVWEAEYDPFGEATITTETITNNLRFPGQYYDEETNLHYNYFRYYDPSTGRYITSDPIGLNGGFNTYLYVNANPLIFFDELGLDPGDLFESADDAAIDAGNYARRFSNQNIEYGGWVYKAGECWTYNFLEGAEDSLPPEALEGMRPSGSRDIWHTHPFGHGYRAEENFSGNYPGTRPGDRTTSRNEDVGVYLNTPRGRNAYYDYGQEPPERDIANREPVECSCQ